MKAWKRFRTAHRQVKEETSEESTSCSKKVSTNDLDCLLGFLQDEVEKRILIATQSFDQSKKSQAISIIAEKLMRGNCNLEYHQLQTFWHQI
ncbi:hypothetical protein NPIL_179731 [Nephila pilipes]|uniref:Uncharacterized protein n=1 Tax=Nephila pilipes TaxID=299642 RepID=A0A8X6MYR8_NEPPI|nr:hypothetical protein NPIL_179731 [Nephila pilipes]